MKRLAPQLSRQLLQHRAAMAAIAGSAAFLGWSIEQNEEGNLLSGEGARGLHWAATTTTTATAPAQCEELIHHIPREGRFVNPTTNTNIRAGPRLRRAKTIDVLTQRANKKTTLESQYNVDWSHAMGEGAFGAVYPALHRETQEKVAVKKISKLLTSNATFEREMDALLLLAASGGHPNVCSLREHFEQDGYFYLVLDLVEGGEMFDRLCEEGAYSEADAARLFRQVASALALMHGIGIVHSDLKPENLMLSTGSTDDAAIKIVDFGCAHLVTADPNDHEHRGTANTPSYCPPEILSIKHGDSESRKHGKILPSFDMWSLGVILYVMLTGIHPFDPNNDCSEAEIIQAVLAGEVQTRSLLHSEYTAHLSPDAIEVIEGLMQWHPEQRWTADRLLQNPWVRGKTASSKKMKQSDKRLAAYRKHKTRLERSFFRAMLDNSNSRMGTVVERKAATPSSKSSVLESAFHILENYEAALAEGGAEQHPSLTFAEMTDLLSDNMKEVYFAKGFEIYKEGDEGHAMYFIVSGAVDVSSQEGFQKQRTAGEFFGSGALMHDTKTRRSSVRCSTHVHALEISREYFEKYVKSDEEVHLTMAENDRLRRRERVRTLLGLQKNMKSEHYQSNEVIVKKGQPGDALYIVEDGIVELSVDGHKVRTLKKGEMTGEHAAYYKGAKPYNATARCISDQCKLSTLQAVDLHKVLSSNPTLRDSFHDIMIRRDFVMAMVAATKQPFPETVEELRTAFDIIDLDKSNEIKDFELRKIMLDFDPSYSEKDLEVMLNSLDLNHSGTMSWSEFKKIFGMANDS